MGDSTEQKRSAVQLSQHPLLNDVQKHIIDTLGNDFYPPRQDTYYSGLAYSVRDRLIQRWLQSQRGFYQKSEKRVYYLSMEYLPGRFLKNYITNLQLDDEVSKAFEELPFTLEALEEQEWDAGLGNGGLGRLASCFLDSMATLKIPAYGCGIRYDYGIFMQSIVNGYQVEKADNWIRNGCPWEIQRTGFLYDIHFYGRTESHTDENGRVHFQWVDTMKVKALACDFLIPGYGTDHTNNMRLWKALSSEEFDLTHFNAGDYTGAMEAKVLSETITKVLYPSDEKDEGKELRLKQQYFLVAATFQDILRRFKKKEGADFDHLPDLVAVQLNDTHPAIAVAEFMRLMLDEEHLGWDQAWEIGVRIFSYTNHTLLPEALETWPVGLMSRLLPRHMEIIYEINRRFLADIEARFPNRPDLLSTLSIIAEGEPKRVRMAHLATIGSHAVNGVAELHSKILKEDLFRSFDEVFPGRLTNVTNGVTPRRWLLQANPELSSLISRHIGHGWVTDLDQLKKLIPLADDPAFREAWDEVKKHKKRQVMAYVLAKTGVTIHPESLFDVHVKRIHAYKRQLLNILHAITLYRRIKRTPDRKMVPRTILMAGKAAPAYHLAKLIIKLANAVAETINHDPDCHGKLNMVFLPNYNISQAEKVIPGTDLSEQISTAGMEASGTGNMKFALNGALTIGTLDGANIEIMEEVGEENIFIFGLTADEVRSWRNGGLYNPSWHVERDAELSEVIGLLRDNHFNPNEPGLFEPILQNLLHHGDYFLVVADYRAYVDTQEKVAELYENHPEWVRRSILNTANMGKFSSDRAIREYAKRIWDVDVESVG